MKKLSFVLVTVILGVVIFTGCGRDDEIYEKTAEIESILMDEKNGDIKELQQQLDEANQKINELQQQNVSTDGNSAFLKLKFRTDGYYYKSESKNMKFYSDPDLTIEIANPRFLSKDADELKDKNDRTIYAYLLDNGTIVYAKDYTSLMEEQKYNEYYNNNIR